MSAVDDLYGGGSKRLPAAGCGDHPPVGYHAHMMLVVPACLVCSLVPGQHVDETPARGGEWGFRPVNGARCEVNPPAFVWRPQAGAVRYSWQLSRKPDFERVAREQNGIRLNVFCPPRTFEPGRWYWRFRYGTADERMSSWSRARSFTILKDTPEFTIPSRAELLRRVPTRHPRLFVRPEQVPELRRLARGSLRADYARLQQHCDELLRAPPPTAEPPRYPRGTVRLSEEWRAIWWGNRQYTIRVLDSAATLAFTWLLSGREAYGELARRLLLAAAAWDPRGATGYRYNDEAGMPYAYHFARAYTFVHDLLDEHERELCRQVMRLRGREMYRHLCPRHLWRPFSSHANRAWHFLGEVAIAFKDEIPEADDWLWFAVNVFGACYPVWSDADGGWHEGLAYWRSYIGRFTWWGDVMKAALEIDGYRKPFFAHVGDWPLYLQPPGTKGGGFGDLAGRLHSRGNARLMRLFAAQAGNPYWQWYADAHGTAERASLGYVDFLRGARERVAARAPADLPTSKLFRGTGIAALNTTLTNARDNVALIFKSSPFGTQSHGYEAQNSFLLYAFGERLLIRSGRRDVYGSAHHTKWMWSTRSANSITIGGRGQIRHSPAAVGRITRFESSPFIDYVEGEAARAYGEQLERFTRSILFVKPALILIFDRLAAHQPSNFEWWLHALAPFEITQQQARVTMGAAACDVRWLVPAGLELRQTDEFDPPPRPRVKLRQYHLTARTRTPRRDAVFVTLLRPRRADACEPSAARLEQRADGWLVRAKLPPGELLVHLARRGEVAAQLSGTGGRLLAEFTR